MSDNPYQAIKTKRKEFEREKELHKKEMRKLYEEFGILEILNLMEEIENKITMSEEVNLEICENFFSFLYELTEDDEVFFDDTFKLEDSDGEIKLLKINVYHTQEPEEISFDRLVRFSGEGSKINPGVRPKNHRPNPFYYLKENISDKTPVEKTGESLRDFFETIEENKDEILTVMNDHREVTKYEDEIKMHAGALRPGNGIITNQLDDILIYTSPCLFCEKHKNKIYFDDFVKFSGDSAVYPYGGEDSFEVNKDSILTKEKFLKDEKIIEETQNLLRDTLKNVEHVLKVNRNVLNELERLFSTHKVCHEI